MENSDNHQWKNMRVAAIGGGTGLAMLLRGLKKYTANLAAIVNVTDDGGSSGRLRQNMNMLPPGDIRNCLLALADTEPLLEKIFQYRFTAGEGLEGHNLGNLFLAALSDVFGFEEALAAAGKVLAVKGKVLPVTLDKLHLVAEFYDGSQVMGESRIPAQRRKITRLRLEPACSVVYPAARQAILEADLVVVGPGSLYTSVLANLLVSGVTEAIRESSACKVYVCNCMTQLGETDNYTAADHLQAIEDHVGTGLFHAVIVNADLSMPPELLHKYSLEGARPVRPDLQRLHNFQFRVLTDDLLFREELVRHDPDRLAKLLLSVAQEGGKKEQVPFRHQKRCVP
ncbi:MAG: YvcK family protein [Dethiobacter sp.]|nr:YvcK family protein [Dethiobacter sp.]MCL5982561.1 YvcK family protein [Bacillota bacterium]